MAVLTVFAIIVLIVGFSKDAFKRPYDKGSLDDVYKFRRDVHDPNVSPKQLDRNIRAGKYRKQ